MKAVPSPSLMVFLLFQMSLPQNVVQRNLCSCLQNAHSRYDNRHKNMKLFFSKVDARSKHFLIETEDKTADKEKDYQAQNPNPNGVDVKNGYANFDGIPGLYNYKMDCTQCQGVLVKFQAPDEYCNTYCYHLFGK